VNEFAQQARTMLGLNLTQSQLAALEQYENELLAWNLRVNLTAIDKPEKIRTKHFLDSLTCLIVMRSSPSERVIDVGTGAGFPGIPLKIICPTIRLALVESVGKKAAFCQHIVDSLGLKNVSVLSERVEAVGALPTHREQYDWAIARAVANLPVLVNTSCRCPRGRQSVGDERREWLAEAQSAENAMRMLEAACNRLFP